MNKMKGVVAAAVIGVSTLGATQQAHAWGWVLGAGGTQWVISNVHQKLWNGVAGLFNPSNAHLYPSAKNDGKKYKWTRRLPFDRGALAVHGGVTFRNKLGYNTAVGPFNDIVNWEYVSGEFPAWARNSHAYKKKFATPTEWKPLIWVTKGQRISHAGLVFEAKVTGHVSGIGPEMNGTQFQYVSGNITGNLIGTHAHWQQQGWTNAIASTRMERGNWITGGLGSVKVCVTSRPTRAMNGGWANYKLEGTFYAGAIKRGRGQVSGWRDWTGNVPLDGTERCFKPNRVTDARDFARNHATSFDGRIRTNWGKIEWITLANALPAINGETLFEENYNVRRQLEQNSQNGKVTFWDGRSYFAQWKNGGRPGWTDWLNMYVPAGVNSYYCTSGAWGILKGGTSQSRGNKGVLGHNISRGHHGQGGCKGTLYFYNN